MIVLPGKLQANMRRLPDGGKPAQPTSASNQLRRKAAPASS
jgi:hypothetical protein